MGRIGNFLRRDTVNRNTNHPVTVRNCWTMIAVDIFSPAGWYHGHLLALIFVTDYHLFLHLYLSFGRLSKFKWQLSFQNSWTKLVTFSKSTNLPVILSCVKSSRRFLRDILHVRTYLNLQRMFQIVPFVLHFIVGLRRQSAKRPLTAYVLCVLTSPVMSCSWYLYTNRKYTVFFSV